MNKIMHLIALLALTACVAVGQETFATGGGDIEGDGSISFTIGQVGTLTVTEKAHTTVTSTASLRAGVQQSYTVDELKIEGVTALPFKVAIYPNPTAENVTIALGEQPEKGHYELYTFDGKMVARGTLESQEQVVEMASLASGTYVLRVAAGGCENNYRIVKIR